MFVSRRWALEQRIPGEKVKEEEGEIQRQNGVSVCPLGSAVCIFVPGFREVFHSGSLSISCGALILSGRVLSSCEEEETRRNSSVEGA